MRVFVTLSVVGDFVQCALHAADGGALLGRTRLYRQSDRHAAWGAAHGLARDRGWHAVDPCWDPDGLQGTVSSVSKWPSEGGKHV